MYRLTERRFARAKPILDKYRERLHTAGDISAGELERELRDCWGVGYQALKGIIEDLAKRNHYRYLAAYYMEHSSAPGVVSEFKPVLAKMYGIRSYGHSPDRESKREAFWQGMKSARPGK
jgi:hypothetical protein